ncbi:hypothetical protein JCM13210_18900 [Thermaerobacter litoralis]
MQPWAWGQGPGPKISPRGPVIAIVKRAIVPDRLLTSPRARPSRWFGVCSCHRVAIKGCTMPLPMPTPTDPMKNTGSQRLSELFRLQQN